MKIKMRVIVGLLLMMGAMPVLADGVYAGVALGAETDRISKSGELVMLNDQYQPIKASKKTVSGVDSAAGVAAEIDLGYRQILSPRFLFSVEADASTGSSQVKEQYLDRSKTNSSTQVLRFTVGASVLPAIRVGRFADVFLRAGLGVGQFKFAADGFMYKLANSRDAVVDTMYGILGLGVDAHYMKHWDFRLEADYVDFAAFDITENRIDDTPAPNPTGQRKIYNYHANYSPSMMRVAIGMSYDF